MNEQPLPWFSDGFGYTTGVTGGLVVVSELSPEMGEESVAVVGEEDPEHDTLALARPDIACLTLYIDPDNPDELLEFEALGLGEELLHGARKRFGLTRNVALLKRRARRGLFEYLRGDIDASTAAEKIGYAQLVARQILEAQERFLESIDQYLMNTTMAEPGYFEAHAQRYARRYDLNADEIAEGLEEHRRGLLASRIEESERYETVYQILEEIGQEWEPTIVQAVADAALDYPHVVAPVVVEGYDSVSLEATELRTILQDRLEAARRALKELTYDPIEAEYDKVLQDLQRELNDVDSRGHVRDVDIPLIDAPGAAHEPEISDTVRELDDPLDRILNHAFRMEGNFGGLVYWTSVDGEQSARWLVNPTIPDDAVDDETYHELWERAYVGDRLLTQLYRRVEEPVNRGRGDYTCPLCLLSAGWCGDGHCAYRPVREAINEQSERLVHELTELEILAT
ncbi:hypothetical protein [Haloarcula sediminis]|uniref:hypothetical protein n=1 Tax=Haloarcula sediminis TaxID=3111777 RepID=UPI002D766F99|nr:hypothetical protein [Haloarcula sp. CK38]